MSTTNSVNYYEILEVATDAPQAEIHRAYQRARTTYAPENPALYSMFTAEEAQDLLRLVEEAWLILGNFGKRKTYDESMGFIVADGTTPTPLRTHAEPTHHHVAATETRVSDLPPRVTRLGDHETVGSYTVRTKDKSIEPTPSGMGRTSLGTYKLDSAMESEIESATEFDGAFMQKIRVYRNVTIDRLSDATRISRTYLMALETNDYKNLPAAVFVRGFVVQVARILGLDENKVAASYMKAFKGGGGGK